MTHLTIRDDYGSESAVIVVEAASRRALSRKVADMNPGGIDTGCGHDCSGRVCGRYAELLRAYRVRQTWMGVVYVTVLRDV